MSEPTLALKPDQNAHWIAFKRFAGLDSPVQPPLPRTNEAKPPLELGGVEALEREFVQNPKPTTQTKRQLAEDVGVELARINVS